MHNETLKKNLNVVKLLNYFKEYSKMRIVEFACTTNRRLRIPFFL